MANFFDGITDFDHKNRQVKIGVLITNLGTPDAPTSSAVRRYLKQFLWDKRVIEVARPLWWLILNGVILRIRPAKSAKLYKSIWTEKGSPLMSISQEQTESIAKHLANRYGDQICVALGMRYGNPSIESALEQLQKSGAERIIVLPLYPQFSSPTTASTFDAVSQTLSQWRWIPEFTFIQGYHDHPDYIQALRNSIQEHIDQHGMPDLFVFSYHGMPKRYLDNGDPYYCYCHKTTRLTAESLSLSEDQYLITFQSRFGREEWLKPYTDKTLESLPNKGKKHIAILCPAFSADCLETLEEIEEENRDVFLEAGGEKFHYIPALNNRTDHIEALCNKLSPYIDTYIK